MILALLTLAVLFALCYPQPKLVVYYLSAKLYGNLILFTVKWLYGDTSPEYLLSYITITSIILLTILVIIADSISMKQRSWRAAGMLGMLSIILGRVAIIKLVHHPQLCDYVGITEGCFLFWAGWTLGYLAPYLERTDLAYTLASLWLAQSYFRIKFYIHILDPNWLAANWLVPPALGVIAYLLIGLLSRHRLRAGIPSKQPLAHLR